MLRAPIALVYGLFVGMHPMGATSSWEILLASISPFSPGSSSMSLTASARPWLLTCVRARVREPFRYS